MNEVTLQEKGNEIKSQLPPPTFAEVSRASGFEREWLRGPLSKDATYRLIVTGDLGPKEIGKLIKMLEAQKEILSDDDEETIKPR